MVCFAQAIPLARGKMFLTVDGDDECVPNALEVFLKEFSDIPFTLKNKLVP